MRQVKKARRLTTWAALGACLLALGPGAIPAAADAPAGNNVISEAGPSQPPQVTTARAAKAGRSTNCCVAEIVDIYVLRPLGALSTLVGAGFFVATLPLTTATNQIQVAKEVLIDTPFQDSFGHPIGAL